MKILITGANGQLGREMSKRLSSHDLILTDVKELDITNLEEVYNFYKTHKPELTINCAAHTQVDKCEVDVDNAYKINAIGPKNLAIGSSETNGEIIQISTDYVFDGEGNCELTEFSKTNPQSVYGESKLQGEYFVKEFNRKHYILRTAWLYGDGNNFVKTMLKLSETHKELKVVNDQIGTPTSVVDLGNVIMEVISKKNYGLFHSTCKGKCSWYEFAKEIFKISNVNINVIPCTTEEFIGDKKIAKRPMYSVLRNYMLELTSRDVTRPWEESIREYLNV